MESLKVEFPELAKDIDIIHGDANKVIEQRFDLTKDWSNHRAVMFLDPFGMQVKWETIETIAKTKAIDLWVLFPLGMALNRLLSKNGDIPDKYRKRINILLGTDKWYEEFYKITSKDDIFGDNYETVEKATIETIGKYFNQRLSEVFAGVSDNPCFLRNSRNCPLYLLCFAVGNHNERAVKLSLRIANHILDNFG